MKGYRVWAEIDLAAFRHNISLVRRAVGPSVRILAVVKADAYGHGAVPIAWTALDAGCSMLGVGDSAEALQLREAGLPGSILILGAVVEEEIPRVVRHDISVTVHSTDLVPRLDEEARNQGRTLGVHLKIDTGLGRLGASPGRACEVARAISDAPNLRFEGVSTHFASGDQADSVRTQLDLFRACLEELRTEGLSPGIVHAANAAALFTCPESHFDMVRPGVALYGMDPGMFGDLGIRLKPVLSLKTRIAYLKGAAQGTPVGYGGRYHTPRATRLATCPVGYNDGYPFGLSNRGHALVRGRRVPVAGSVSMDYITLDVGRVPETEVGDEVTLIGNGLKVEELAEILGTIPHELTCGLGRRVVRVPAETGVPVSSPPLRIVA